MPKVFLTLGMRASPPALFCPQRRLAVELDGGQHFEPAALNYDRRRTDFLAGQRVSVLRFTNDQVLCEIDLVLEAIHRFLGSAAIPSPRPSPR